MPNIIRRKINEPIPSIEREQGDYYEANNYDFAFVIASLAALAKELGLSKDQTSWIIFNRYAIRKPELCRDDEKLIDFWKYLTRRARLIMELEIALKEIAEREDYLSLKELRENYHRDDLKSASLRLSEENLKIIKKMLIYLNF